MTGHRASAKPTEHRLGVTHPFLGLDLCLTVCLDCGGSAGKRPCADSQAAEYGRPVRVPSVSWSLPNCLNKITRPGLLGGVPASHAPL